MDMKRLKSVIYVNYSPYENSGKILDFLLENFESVFLFSVGFHNLKNKKKYNILYIYKRGKLLEEHLLLSFHIRISSWYVFFLIPIRSTINFIQILWYSFFLKKRFGTIDIYFSVNAFTAWIGAILKSLKIVRRTVFWVWDYYPPINENKIIMLMRYIYWQFDKISSHADRLAFVNRRLVNLRKNIGVLPEEAEYPIVPIGTDAFPIKPRPKPDTLIFGFIGVLKKSQGFGIVYDNAKEILTSYRNARYEIVGSGPDEEFFKKKAKESSIPTVFHGYVEGDLFNEILDKCSIGIATYIPDKRNVSQYGDPGKIKRYLSLGIPVIATNVFEFSEELKKSKAGAIVSYDKPEEFMGAVDKIMENYKEYSKNALKLSNKFYYKKIYPEIFEFEQ